MLIVGLIGTFAGFLLGIIPIINQYKLPIQIISIIVLVFAVYSEGSITNNEEWQAKVKEQENKVALAEQQSNDLNDKIQESLKVKTNIIQERKNETKKEIITYVHDECKLTNAFISLHDSSSQSQLPDSSIGTITGTSNVKVSELLETITDNYSTYYEQVEKIKAWQDWYKKNKDFFDKVNQ
jgi:cellobiose-specific phosphotransferase system component IIA